MRPRYAKAVTRLVLLAALGAGLLDCGQRKRAHAPLEPQYGTLEVRSDPAGATILVDGRDYASVTPDDFTLSAGAHLVTVSLAGHSFAPASTTLAVPADGTVTYTFLEFAPRLVPGASAHAFDPQALETSSAEWCVEVTNEGRAVADTGAFALSGPGAGAFRIVSGGTWHGLAPNASQQLCVAFQPASPGAQQAVIRVGDTDVTLTGTGYKPPCDLGASENAHDFGAQDAGASYPAWCFDITNHDTARCSDTLHVTGAAAGEFAITSGAAFDLAPGATQTVCVEFRPAQAGARTATIAVGTNTVTLSGTGVGSGQIAAPATPEGTDFGSVCTDAEVSRRIVVTNTGNLACTVNAAGCGEFAVSPASRVVSPGTNATFTVTFQPAVVGVAPPCAVMLSDGTNAWPVSFTGTGIAVPLADFTPSGGIAAHAGSGVPFVAQVQANGSPVTSYAWDFGDGGTSTSASPTHRFSAGGTYQVSLSVTNACGTSPAIAHTICIDEPAYVLLYHIDPTSVPDYTTNIPGWGTTVPLVLYRGLNAAYGALPQVTCTNVFSGEMLSAGRDNNSIARGASEALGTTGQSFDTASLPVDASECSVISSFTLGSPSWSSNAPTFYLKTGGCGHQSLGLVSGAPPAFCTGVSSTFHCASSGDARLEWGLEPSTLARWCAINAIRFTYDCWYVCPGSSGPQKGVLRVVDER